jgi:hypothetical protein
MDNFYFGEVKALRDEGIIKICAGGFSSFALSSMKKLYSLLTVVRRWICFCMG